MTADIFAIDERGDIHLITPAQRDSIVAGVPVVVELENDEGRRTLLRLWTPRVGIVESDWDYTAEGDWSDVT